MTETDQCKPWCEKHEVDEDLCTALIPLFTADEPDSDSEEQNPELAALRATFAENPLIPDQIDTVFLDIMQEVEMEQPELLLRFWKSTKDEDSAQLQVSVEDLKYLHTNLGEAIRLLD